MTREEIEDLKVHVAARTREVLQKYINREQLTHRVMFMVSEEVKQVLTEMADIYQHEFLREIAVEVRALGSVMHLNLHPTSKQAKHFLRGEPFDSWSH